MSETITIKIDLSLSGIHAHQRGEVQFNREDWEGMDENEQHAAVFDYVSSEMINFGWEVQS